MVSSFFLPESTNHRVAKAQSLDDLWLSVNLAFIGEAGRKNGAKLQQ